MLDALTKHLTAGPSVCSVSKWITTLSDEEQAAFITLRNSEIVVAALYKDLNDELNLPFKLTAFRSHMRGYCTCQN